MIITRLTGGLGNQMFQYAAGLALAERRGTVVKIDVSWFGTDPTGEAHNRYALDCFRMPVHFATAEEADRARGVRLTRIERWSVRAARLLRFRQYAARHAGGGNLHYAERFSFYPAFFDQPDPTYLHGMWQSEKFFAPAEERLRREFVFRYPPSPEAAAMEARIRSAPSAAVHFRRGDYVRQAVFNRELGLPSPDYYRQATALIRERHPDATLYIFSDDIDAIEKEFSPPGPHVFVRSARPGQAYDDLRLMSACRHAVISNSTFSWWAAWLARAPGQTVVAPDPWFAASQHDSSEVVPPGWIRLPSRPEAAFR